MNEKKSKKNNSKHVWDIHKDPKTTSEQSAKLEDALGEKNLEEIKKILSDAKTLRSFIVRKGEKGKTHLLLERSLFFLLMEEKVKEGIHEIINFLHKNSIPEQILNELTHVYYHRHDKDNFLKWINLIINNTKIFHDPEVVSRAKHDWASWKMTWEKDFNGAIELNKSVIEEARKIGSKILEKKALFGLTYGKDIKHKNKASGFGNLSRDLQNDLQNEYDSARSEIEKARNLLSYAKLKAGSFKEKLIQEAKEKALEILKTSINIGYPQAEFLASDLLGKIYAEIGDLRKAKSYQKRAEKLKKLYS